MAYLERSPAMFAREADSQIRPDELAVVKLEFVAGAAVDEVHAEMASPIIAPSRVVETLDRQHERVNVTRQ